MSGPRALTRALDQQARTWLAHETTSGTATFARGFGLAMSGSTEQVAAEIDARYRGGLAAFVADHAPREDPR